MRLSDIQNEFEKLVLKPGHEAGIKIFHAGSIALDKRLDVYRNNVMTAVSKAVTKNFPLLEKLVGRDFLSMMVRDYIRARPPVEGCLTFYGSDFDDFVTGYKPASALPYLPDMARLEIAINAAYHASDDQTLTPDYLARIPAEKLADFFLKLRDNVQLVKSRYPLDAIRDLCLNDAADKLNIDSGGVCLLIHRPRLEVGIQRISESEYDFLTGLRTKNLGQTVEEMLSMYPDFDFQKTLQRFMNLEVFLKDNTV